MTIDDMTWNIKWKCKYIKLFHNLSFSNSNKGVLINRLFVRFINCNPTDWEAIQNHPIPSNITVLYDIQFSEFLKVARLFFHFYQDNLDFSFVVFHQISIGNYRSCASFNECNIPINEISFFIIENWVREDYTCLSFTKPTKPKCFKCWANFSQFDIRIPKFNSPDFQLLLSGKL